MKKTYNRCEKLHKELFKIQCKMSELEEERERKTIELEQYVKRHRSLKFDNLQTESVEKLKQIYSFMDKNYIIDWEGGIRCDNRGMKLCFWLADDPDFLIIHLTSTSGNIYFSGSTSWIVPAKTLQDKIEVLKNIKETVLKIIKG